MDIVEFRKIIDENGIIFSFSGLITQEMIINIVETIKNKLEDFGANNQIINAIFAISVEQMQNIINYSKDKHEYDVNKYSSDGICIIGFDKKKDKFFVSSSNKVVNNDIDRISIKIDEINSLNLNEQKKLSRTLLKTGQFSHDRGAGIGLIEMAKRSNEKLEYKFVKYRDEEFFELKVYIG